MSSGSWMEVRPASTGAGSAWEVSPPEWSCNSWDDSATWGGGDGDSGDRRDFSKNRWTTNSWWVERHQQERLWFFMIALDLFV
jgi:hypothetical protein